MNINLGLSMDKIVEWQEESLYDSSESIEGKIAKCDSKEELKRLASCYGLNGCALWFKGIINHPLMDMDVMLVVINNALNHVLPKDLVEDYILPKLNEFERSGIDTSILEYNPAWQKIRCRGTFETYLSYYREESGNYWSSYYLERYK